MQTYESLYKFISHYFSKTGAKPDRDLCLTLINNALDELSIRESSFSNTASIAGINYLAIPETYSKITRVEYDGTELEYMNPADMDYYYPYWRTDTGIPSAYTTDGTTVWTNAADTNASTGILVCYGWCTVGHFDIADESENPLIYIPVQFQVGIAYYVLANLPMEENEATALFRQRYEMKWEMTKSRIFHFARKRGAEEFIY